MKTKKEIEKEIIEFLAKKYKSLKLDYIIVGEDMLKVKVKECKTDFRYAVAALFKKYPWITYVDNVNGWAYTRTSLKYAGFYKD